MSHPEFATETQLSNTASPLSSDWYSGDLLETLPAAVYVCDAEGVVVAYNRRAAELWGRTPEPGDTDEKYCGAHKLECHCRIMKRRWRLFSERENRLATWRL